MEGMEGVDVVNMEGMKGVGLVIGGTGTGEKDVSEDI